MKGSNKPPQKKGLPTIAYIPKELFEQIIDEESLLRNVVLCSEHPRLRTDDKAIVSDTLVEILLRLSIVPEKPLKFGLVIRQDLSNKDVLLDYE